MSQKSMPSDVVKQVENISALNPDDHIALVRFNMTQFEEAAKNLWPATQKIREGMEQYIRQVHEATNHDGIHVALLEHLLQFWGYDPEESRQLIEDLIKSDF